MKRRRLEKSIRSSYQFEEFLKRFDTDASLCFVANRSFDRTKLRRIHDFCERHGFILNHSTIYTIQNSFADMLTSAFDPSSNNHKSSDAVADIKLQLTHVNALPSRKEQGIFIIIELGNPIEDVRYNLVALHGKQIPSHSILHSRGYDLSQDIRKSKGILLVDQLAIGLKDFLDEITLNTKLTHQLQLGLLLHFPIKQNELNHAEILTWSNRFNCPDLQQHDFISLLRQSIQKYLLYYDINIIACVQESVAALVSVAFEYPNTRISLVFNHTFQLSFVEDIELMRSKQLFQPAELRALYQTILSFNLRFVHSKKSMKSHALFQTLLTFIDINVIKRLNVNYFDLLTCDSCLLEILRLLIIELCEREQLLPNELWSKSKLTNHGSICLKFVSLLLQGKYVKLKPYLENLGLRKIKKQHLVYMEYLCHVIIRRSTNILSCLIACLSDRYKEENLTVAIDSHLYRLCPIYQLYLHCDIEHLRKPWMTMFHCVNATSKTYLGPAVVMGLQKTQKAMFSQDDNMSHLFMRNRRKLFTGSAKLSSL